MCAIKSTRYESEKIQLTKECDIDLVGIESNIVKGLNNSSEFYGMIERKSVLRMFGQNTNLYFDIFV